MIVEKASGKPYADVVRDVFGQVGLKSTYYEQFFYPAAITDRMVSGYFFNTDPGNEPLKPLLGHDVRTDSVSWMQGAGGIVSSPADVAAWARALYEGPLLADKQRRELETRRLDEDGQADRRGRVGCRPLASSDSASAKAHRPVAGHVLVLSGRDAGLPRAVRLLPEERRGHRHRHSEPPEKQNENGKLMQQLYGILEKAGKALELGRGPRALRRDERQHGVERPRVEHFAWATHARRA